MTIIPRQLAVDFAAVPRHWLAGNATATAIANGVNLLFPHGERFFVRAVKHYLPAVTDPTLRAQIKGFFGQEGRHAREHERATDVLRAQGFEVDAFLDRYQQLTGWIEAHASPALRLAVTAAAEHFTALLAEGAFEHHMLDRAAPEMRDLLAWHAAEEIEHRAVAFDVLQQVDPSYLLRVRGLVLATAILAGCWGWATAMLLRQERLGPRAALRQLRAVPDREPIIRRVFARGIRAYLRRDFHPAHHDAAPLVEKWFADHGLQLPPPVAAAPGTSAGASP